MDDRNLQPFERQVADVTQRAVGPERHVEALAIARHAREQSRRRGLGRVFGVVQFAAGALVVALFAAALLMSGVLDGPEDGEVGASPSPNAEATDGADPVAAKVAEVTGALTSDGRGELILEELAMSGELKELGGMNVESGEVRVDFPWTYIVDASDPRLSGEAFVLTATATWTHTITAADVDDPRPEQDWTLEAKVGRVEIRNDEGVWSGTIGPNYEAVGEEPIDDIVNNAPRQYGGTPMVLIGGGGYDGLTAYLWPIEDDLDSGFTGLVVNSGPVLELSEQTWAEGLAALEKVDAASE